MKASHAIMALVAVVACATPPPDDAPPLDAPRETPCVGAADCASGEFCDGDLGVCRANECTTSNDCPDGESCRSAVNEVDRAECPATCEPRAREGEVCRFQGDSACDGFRLGCEPGLDCLVEVVDEGFVASRCRDRCNRSDGCDADEACVGRGCSTPLRGARRRRRHLLPGRRWRPVLQRSHVPLRCRPRVQQ